MNGMLKAENVTVRYGARTVVQDLSFELKEGEWRLLTEAEVEALQRIRSGS